MFRRRLAGFSCSSLLLLGQLAHAEPSVTPAPATPATTPLPPAPAAPPNYLGNVSYTPPAFISEPTVLPPQAATGPSWRLSKSDVIQAVLRNNLGIQLERENVRAGQFSEQASGGAFEPNITASYRHRDADSPPSNTQEGQAGEIINSIDNTWNVAGSKQFQTGTQTTLSLNNDWARSSQGNALSPDLFRTSADLTLTQPLLRGFSTDGDIQTAPILRAHFASERALAQAQLRAASAVLTAENAYWDLTEALKSYQVRVRSWELASEQLKLTERQIQAGVLPPSDLINAEGTLARRELALLEAEGNIEQSADRLKQIMNLPDPEWKKAFLTLDAPRFVALRPDVPKLIAEAQARRPEVSQTNLDLRQATLDQRVADNAKLPDLSASVSYGLIGQDASYSGSLAELGHARGRYWSTLVRLNWSPLNEQRRAEAERASITRRRTNVEKNQLLLNIRVEVRQAARALETAEKQLYAAANSRSLSEQSLSAEERKFQNGLSNNFFVSQRQDELAQAQLAELSALIRHEKARADLQLATGDLLQQRNVRLDLSAR